MKSDMYTDGQTCGQTCSLICGQMDRHEDSKTDMEANIWIDGQTFWQTDRHRREGRHMDGWTDIWTCGHTDRHYMWTDGQTRIYRNTNYMKPDFNVFVNVSAFLLYFVFY